MIKQLAALAATALFSLNASAGYVRYDLTGPVNGFFIQNEDDKSVAYYRLRVVDQNVSASFAPSNTFDNIMRASTIFRGPGPTNFAVYNALTDYYFHTLSFSFTRGREGAFDFSAYFTQQPEPFLPITAPSFPVARTYYGEARRGTLDTIFVWDTQGIYMDGLIRIVPTFVGVPEPASIALLALGLVGLAGSSRRRKAAK